MWLLIGDCNIKAYNDVYRSQMVTIKFSYSILILLYVHPTFTLTDILYKAVCGCVKGLRLLLVFIVA
jgi:hypothetical protein